jgi:signal transduction histidine kinase
MYDVYLVRVRTLHEKVMLSRRAAMNHTVSSIAHDLKTPLQSFQMGLDAMSLMISSSQQTVPISDLKTDLVESLDHLVSTYKILHMSINRMLDFARLNSSLTLKPNYDDSVCIDESVTFAVNCLHNLQNKVRIISMIGKDIVGSAFITDKSWFEENILCLLSNAIKHTRQDHVLLSIHLAMSSKRSKTRCIRVEVSDSGQSPLTSADIGRIFKPVFFAERKDGGIGIGLHILYHRYIQVTSSIYVLVL